MSIEAEVFGFSSGLFGGRPTFALVRKLGDNPGLSLYELLPKDLADGRENRIEQSRRHQSLRRKEMDDVLVGIRYDGETRTIVVKKDLVITDSERSITEWKWSDWDAVPVATLCGQRQRVISKLIQSVLEDSGIDSARALTGEGTALISEPAGVRIAVAFLGIRRLQKHNKLVELVSGVEQMRVEECYYWHAKCRSPSSSNGIKALRALLTSHID